PGTAGAPRPAGPPGATGAGTGRPGGGPPPQPRPVQPARPAPAPRDPFDDEEEPLEDYNESSSRLARALSTLGVGLIGVIAVQVITAILEGLAARASQLEPNGIETDLLHRLGFPFGSLGAPAILFLIVGLGLLAIPILLGEETTSLHDRFVGVALIAVIALAVVIAVGSLLAVRYQLYQFTTQGLDPPPYARIGFSVFLLGSLGAAAVAVFGSLATMSARRRA
ncbi:MAG: hypothetical protein ACRD2W_08425, partial [Acidimicrobiales bacterium]